MDESDFLTRGEVSEDTVNIVGEVDRSAGQGPTRDSHQGPTGTEGASRVNPSSEPASVPQGSSPAGSQTAVVGFDELGECEVGGRGAADAPCFDSGVEQILLPEDDAGDGEGPEGPGPPESVSGAELAVAIREFASVQISPAPLIMQPDQDWHLVNLPVIVRTEPQAQEFSTTLLGLPVQIRAQAASYSWDFGDGSPVLNTTQPGAPFPNQTLEHTYTRAGQYQITLVTYWSGSFQVAASPWIDIDGLGITTTTSPTLDLQTRTTRLTG